MKKNNILKLNTHLILVALLFDKRMSIYLSKNEDSKSPNETEEIILWKGSK